MKLPSSPLIVYSTLYTILFLLAILLHFILLPFVPSPLVRFSIIDCYVTCILYLIGNFMFQSNNIYDLHWPLIPLISSIYLFFTTKTFESLTTIHLFLFLAIFLWSSHLIWQTTMSSENINHEDWRYETMRNQYKDKFLVFAFFGLHILPMIEVLFGSTSIYYLYQNLKKNDPMTMKDAVIFGLMYLGIVLENLADRQLQQFRKKKEKSREHKFSVLSTGLWKYSRHPNYLGEIIFWWTLFLLGYVHNSPIWCALGPLLITLMMIFGSIPMTEDRMYRKYPEYKFLMQRVPMLIPTFYTSG